MKLELQRTKPYVVAELGTSCDGSVGNLVELARHAVAAGASAIKVQDHSGQRLAKPQQEFPAWFNGARYESRIDYLHRQSMQALGPVDYDGAYLGPCYYETMKRHGPQVPLIVSPFSVQAVRDCAKHADALKVASGQVTNHELIRACVETGKPIIVSSGMTTWEETRAALRLVPNEQLWATLCCTSEYPCPPEHVCFGEKSYWPAENWPKMGFSDHTDPDSTAAAIVALTRGARVFERHVCFSQKMYGSDSRYACTLDQFEHYCRELDRASRIPTQDIRDENAARLAETRKQFLHGAQ